MMMGMLGGHAQLQVQVTAQFLHVITSGTDVAGLTTVPSFVTGGFPPYTYSWTDTNANVSVTGASSATPIMAYLATGSDVTRTTTFILSVTDAAGRVAIASCSAEIDLGSPP